MKSVKNEIHTKCITKNRTPNAQPLEETLFKNLTVNKIFTLVFSFVGDPLIISTQAFSLTTAF